MLAELLGPGPAVADAIFNPRVYVRMAMPARASMDTKIHLMHTSHVASKATPILYPALF